MHLPNELINLILSFREPHPLFHILQKVIHKYIKQKLYLDLSFYEWYILQTSNDITQYMV